jgi:hypothetical protein
VDRLQYALARVVVRALLETALVQHPMTDLVREGEHERVGRDEGFLRVLGLIAVITLTFWSEKVEPFAWLSDFHLPTKKNVSINHIVAHKSKIDGRIVLARYFVLPTNERWELCRDLASCNRSAASGPGINQRS